MFDYHLHSNVSFDSKTAPIDIANAAKAAGLCEICFTDHFDYNDDRSKAPDLFALADYRAAYDELAVPGLTIRRGVEFGLTPWNMGQLSAFAGEYPFDFIIGSVHYAGGHDPYEAAYWQGNVEQDFARYLEQTLRCVQVHDTYDVLGHLTYVCKSVHNPSHAPVLYSKHREITDAILQELVKRGKGMEINTSGVDRAGDYLPSEAFLRRFKELGGEIVTVGSDAHDPSRVGQYVPQALQLLKDIFGHVCTFQNRQPVFHKL